jgi:hypothetical protein
MRAEFWVLLLVAGCEVTPKGGRPEETGSTTSETTDETAHTGTPAPVDSDADGFASDVDCDDADPGVFPGAPQRCDTVDTDCDGAPEDVLLVPAEFATVQAAVDASAPGDFICLEAGTFTGRVAIAAGVDVTVGSLVGGRATLAGDGGRALDLDGSDAAVRLVDLDISGASGGVSAVDGSLVLERVTFDGVSCDCAGAVVLSEDARVELLDVAVVGASQTAGPEGLIFADGGELYVRDVTVTHATTTAANLGAVLSLRGVDADFDGLVVTGTTASSPGVLQGGVLWSTSSTLVARHVALLDNTATSTGGVSGGQIYWFSGEATLESFVIAGAIADSGPAGSVTSTVLHDAIGDFTLRQGAIVGNRAIGLDCVGAVAHVGGSLVLSGVAVQGNRAACTNVPVAAVDGSATDLAVVYSAFWDNDGGDLSGTNAAIGVDGNQAADGLFVSAVAEAWDLHLGAGSALIDASDPVLLDVDGTPADIGAYGGPNGSWP